MIESPTSQIARYPRSFNVTVSPDQVSSHETKCKVEYFEYQAFGQPLQNLGTIGDIYVDLTKGSHMLYAKVEDGWKRWPGPGQRNSSPRHPTYGTYMLWCRVEKNSLGWISQNLITRILMSSASQAVSTILSRRLTALRKLKKNANDEGLSFSVPPVVNARPTFITRSSIPQDPPHPPQGIESKTETRTGTTEKGTIKRKARTKPNQIVGTESVDAKDLEEMRAYVMMTLMNAANGTQISTASLSPKRDSNKPALETGTSSQRPAHLLSTPSLPLALDSNKPELEAGTSPQRPAHLLFTPSLSPKLDSNKPELEAGTSSQRPAHLLFTPSLSPKLDSNKPELEAGASSQRPAHLLFTPSLSPKPTPKLPGPDLAHIFTPTASPPPAPTPESKPNPTHGLPHAVTPLPKLPSTNSSSSTLSGTSSASKPEPPRSSGSGTRRSSIKRPAPLSHPCSPADLPKTTKKPKTFQTPEKRMVPSLSSSSSSQSVGGSSRKKVLSVKKPVISPWGVYTLCAPMDLDDDEGRGVSGFGDEAIDSRAFLPSSGDRGEFWDGDGDEPMDGVRRTASDLLPHGSPSKPASERLAARKRTSAVPASKRLAARKRTSMPVSPTKKGGEQLATENAKGKGKGRDTSVANGAELGLPEARPMSRRPSSISRAEQDYFNLSARSKGKGKEKPVSVKKELEKEKVDFKKEDEEGDDSDIVVVSVVKRGVPVVTLSPTKLRLKDKKWPVKNPKPKRESSPSPVSGAGPSSTSSLSLSPGRLKVMPRVKDRRPSEQIKRTATVDRKPPRAKVSGEVIDLTMDSDDDEDEEERERRNIRPLLLLKASKSCYEDEEREKVKGVVERDQGGDCGEVGSEVGGGRDKVVEDALGDVSRDDMENDAPREEADDDQGIQVETTPAPVDGPGAGCEMGQGSDMDDKMMEDPGFPTEEPAPEREPTVSVDGRVVGLEGQVEDDKMVEDPSSPAEDPSTARGPTLESVPLAPALDPILTREDPGMDCDDLPVIAAVDESAHQTESETETLDGDDGNDGDAEMWDDTMVYGLDDADGEKRVDDEDEDEEQEVDELVSDEESDLDRAAETRREEMVLNLLFGAEGMGACERYCRLCLSHGKVIYAVQVRDTPDDRWSFVRQTVIEHCALNHAQECQALLGMGIDKLTILETKLANGRAALTED